MVCDKVIKTILDAGCLTLDKKNRYNTSTIYHIESSIENLTSRIFSAKVIDQTGMRLVKI